MTQKETSEERVYRRVEHEALTQSEARTMPIAVLIGGQPGAGKSVLARQTTEDLKKLGGSVLIDANRMRENDPDYRRLARTDPAIAAERTQVQAARSAVRLTNAAMQAQRNIVVISTMRNPENLALLLSRLEQHGYFVEVRARAVHPEVSLARTQLRFEREYAAMGVGRAVSVAHHDAAAAGMLLTVASLEHESGVKALRLYDARGQLIYHNSRHQGAWVQLTGADQAIKAERERPLTHDEIATHAGMLDQVWQLMRNRHAPVAQQYAVSQRHEAAVASLKQMAAEKDAAFTERHGEVRDPKAQVPSADAPGFATVVRALAAANAPAVQRQQRKQDRLDVTEATIAQGLGAQARVAQVHDAQAHIQARAGAFDLLRRDQAIALYPELDAAFKHLDEHTAFATVPQMEVARAELSERLHRGDLPKSDVTQEESRHAISLAGQRHNLILRDAEQLERRYSGEVVGSSSHHTLVKISEMVGVVYPRARLAREVQPGEQVSIDYARDAATPYAVHDKAQSAEHGEPGVGHGQAMKNASRALNPARSSDHARERDIGSGNGFGHDR